MSSPPPTRLLRTRRPAVCLFAPWCGDMSPSLRRGQNGLPRKALEALARQFVPRVCLATDVSHAAPTAPAPLADLMHRDSKTIAGRHPASHNRRAVRAHDHAVVGPAGRGQIQGPRAHVRLKLSGAAKMRKAE